MSKVIFCCIFVSQQKRELERFCLQNTKLIDPLLFVCHVAIVYKATYLSMLTNHQYLSFLYVYINLLFGTNDIHPPKSMLYFICVVCYPPILYFYNKYKIYYTFLYRQCMLCCASKNVYSQNKKKSMIFHFIVWKITSINKHIEKIKQKQDYTKQFTRYNITASHSSPLEKKKIRRTHNKAPVLPLFSFT